MSFPLLNHNCLDQLIGIYPLPILFNDSESTLTIVGGHIEDIRFDMLNPKVLSTENNDESSNLNSYQVCQLEKSSIIWKIKLEGYENHDGLKAIRKEIDEQISSYESLMKQIIEMGNKNNLGIGLQESKLKIHWTSRIKTRII